MPRSVPACTLNDKLHCARTGLRPREPNSSDAQVRPKNPRSSWISSRRSSHAPASPSDSKIIASHNLGLRHRDDELAAAPAVLRLLREDLVCEVPGEKEHASGHALEKRFRRTDRQVCARREHALLDGAAIDDEIQDVAADPEA